jgi:hypothetical protein
MESNLTFYWEETMTSQRIGYIRVSSLDQNAERQLDGIHMDKVFTDKASGKDTNRLQLQASLNHVKCGEDCPAARTGSSRSKPDKAGERIWDKQGDSLPIYSVKGRRGFIRALPLFRD